MSGIITRHRAGLAVLAIMAVLFSVTMTWSMTSGAEASPNRRLCHYVKDAPTKVNLPSQTHADVYNPVPALVFVSLNYTKDDDKDCPKLDTYYLIGGDNDKAVRFSFKQPVPKVECQDWYRTIGVRAYEAPIKYLGSISKEDPGLNIIASNPDLSDPCVAMDKDTIYEFYVIAGNHYFTDGSEYLDGQFASNKRFHV